MSIAELAAHKKLNYIHVMRAEWPVKSRQKSIKVAQKWFQSKKLKILTPLQKFPKNVWDLGKLTVATGFEKLPKVK